MEKFVLIDGNAILHRAFHALPPLSSKGEPVNAVYGFFSMFLKIIGEVNPHYITVCFDKAAPTFRKELYVGYQATRPRMDNDLVPQIKKVHDVLEKMKVCYFEVDGYEADDLIGTLSKKGVEGKLDGPLDVIIVSGDRDMLQLVNHHVKVLAPIVGITKMILFDEAKVEEKYGLKVSQIVDYKALVGDPSDNYPGVSGIGPKTASALLKEYKTLENLYNNLEEVKKKNENLALKLAQGAEPAGMAKKLATIVTDAPITLEIDKCRLEKIDVIGAKAVFSDFGFKSLLTRISDVFALDPPKKEFPIQKEKEKDKKSDEQLGLL